MELETRPDLEIYDSVWHEEQNARHVPAVRQLLKDGDAFTLSFQPGDATRYELMLIPIIGPARALEISDDGRAPKFGYSGMPLALMVRIMNSGFAEKRDCLFGSTYVTATEVQKRMQIRNFCAAMAVAATINELWAS